MGEFAEILVQGIVLGGIYSLVALGLVVIYKSSGVLNLAQGSILMILAYIMWVFYVSLGLPLIVSFVLLLLTSALMGLVIERLLLRPMIGRPVLSTLMLTLVLGFFLSGVATLAWGGNPNSFVPSFIPKESVRLGWIEIPGPYVWSFVVAVAIFLVFVYLFRYTRLGLSMRAVAESHRLSQSMGINVKRVFALSWVISCIVAAAGGVFLGSIAVVGPALGQIGLYKALPVVILGGMESIPGALIGGFIIGIAELMGSQYLGPAYRDMTPLILMLLILMIRPNGLFGLKIIERI